MMIKGLIGGATLLCAMLATPAIAQSVMSCGDIERSYDEVKADAVSLQINTALFATADSGCEPLARALIAAGASVKALDARGAMPLAHAARAGRTALVQLFLADGAEINARNVDGGTALLAAAQRNRLAVVALLLAKGADPNLAGRSGVTPLMAAAYKGNDRIVADLLAHRANPKARDRTDKSAMTYAAARGFDAVVRRLLGAGIDARERYGNDLTALMWAAGHGESVDSAAAERTIDVLLAHGAPIDGVENRGRTALMIAAEVGDPGVVAFLIDRGADRARKDKQGKTALDLAASNQVRQILETK
jgi:ankyrin repeat protein